MLVAEAEQHPHHHLLEDHLAEQVEQVFQEHKQHQELNVVLLIEEVAAVEFGMVLMDLVVQE